jgi:hypothetical protein
MEYLKLKKNDVTEGCNGFQINGVIEVVVDWMKERDLFV